MTLVNTVDAVGVENTLMRHCYTPVNNYVNRWKMPFLFPSEFCNELTYESRYIRGIRRIPTRVQQVWGSSGYQHSVELGNSYVHLSIPLRKAIYACMQLPLEVIQQLPIAVVQSYLPAVSRTKPGYIRFLARPEHLSDDRWTITKAGRFLRRHCPHLSDEEVKQLSAAVTGACSEYELKFTAAGDADKIAAVYRHGPNSCQSGYKPYRHGEIQVGGDFYAPTRIYGHPDNNLRLAYLETPSGQYVARAWVNVKNMTHNKIYASSDTFYGADLVMQEFLKEYGYHEDGEACMLDEILLRVDTDCGAIICPFIDPGNLGVTIHDAHLRIGGRYDADYETGCLDDYNLDSGRERCARCDEFHNEEDLRYVEDIEEMVCENCLDADFVWAEVGGCFGNDWVHIDNAKQLLDGDYVQCAHLRTGDFVHLDWGRHQGEYCRLDDAVNCEVRGWCYIRDVQEQGLYFCHECGSLMLPDDDCICPLCGEDDNCKV